MSEAYRLKKMIGAQLLCREGQGQGPHKSGSMLPQYFNLLQCQHHDTLDSDSTPIYLGIRGKSCYSLRAEEKNSTLLIQFN